MGISGVVAMEANDDGFIYRSAAGYRDIEGTWPMTLDSIWVMIKATISIGFVL